MTTQPKPEEIPAAPKQWYRKKKFMIPFAILVFAVAAGGGSSEDEPKSDSQKVSSEPAKIEESKTPEPTGGEYGDYPSSQLKFVQIIEKARDAINDAETDLQESVALRTRDKDLCSALGGRTATNWTGVIGSVGANGEGKAYVTVDIGDNMKVSTWNNSFSDISDNTLIPTSSKFFDNLVSLKKGDPVTFSGTFLRDNNSCLKKGNLTQFFYGIDPKFIFRFSSVASR